MSRYWSPIVSTLRPYVAGEQVGVWTTINGLRAEPEKAEGGKRKAES